MSVIEDKKRLVYYIYVPKAGLPEIYKYHFACLEYFSNVFDEYSITIAADDVNDQNILAVESLFLKFGYKNISFNVIENNNNYREVCAFKTDILDKLKTDTSLTFFAHAKGASNVFNDSLIIWICSMYYFCLNFMDNMIHKMINQSPRIFYGPVAYYTPIMAGIRYNWIYPGTFYWINMNTLYNYSLMHDLPRLEGRAYVENFPGNITPLKGYSLHEQMGLAESNFYFDDTNSGRVYDFYNEMPELLKTCFDKDRYDKFIEFVNTIKLKVNNQ